MRTLIVTQYFWPESFRINDAALGLKYRGHEVTVLTGMPNYPYGRFFKGYGYLGPSQQSYEGIQVRRVPLLPRGNSKGIRLALNYLSFAAAASLLGPFRCRGSYDLILVYEPSPVTVGLPAIVLKKLKSAPIMFWVQDLWPESLSAVGAVRSERVLGWVARMVRYIYERCDKVLVQSVGFILRVEARGAKAADILYFPNWAEEFYRPVHPEGSMIERSKLPVGFLVMFAGNIAVAQSFDTILVAATKLKDYAEIHWVVLGDGRMRRWVEKRVKHLGLEDKVHLLGRQPAETMPHYFAFADILPSIHENFGNTVLEAPVCHSHGLLWHRAPDREQGGAGGALRRNNPGASDGTVGK